MRDPRPNRRLQRSCTTALVLASVLVMSACGTRATRDEVIDAVAPNGVGAVGGGETGSGTTDGLTGTTTGATSGTGATGTGTGTGSATTGAGTGGAGASTGTTGTAGRPGTPGSNGSTATTGATAGTGTTGAPGSGTTGGGSLPIGVITGGTANKSPVNIAVVGTFSGPVGNLVKDQVVGVRIWASFINDNGGVNGHPVKVLVGDDGGDPAKFNSLVQQFADQDKVIGFIGSTLGFSPNGNNSVAKGKGIVTFGTEGGLEQAYTDTSVASPIPSAGPFADAMLFAMARVAVPKKETKLAAFTCSDFALCDVFNREWTDPEKLKQLGMTATVKGKPSLTQPDYTSQCLSAKQAGAQVIMLALDTAAIRRFAGDCARQGYKPRIGTADLLANPSLPSDPNVDGLVIGTKVAPFTSNLPIIQTIKAALARYAPGTEITGGTVAGWANVSLFGEASRNLPDNPTPKDVMDGLYKIKDNDLFGITYKQTWTRGKASPKKLCYGTIVISGGKYTQGPGQTFACPY